MQFFKYKFLFLLEPGSENVKNLVITCRKDFKFLIIGAAAKEHNIKPLL